jgi:cytochrome c biogenesis protein CcdA
MDIAFGFLAGLLTLLNPCVLPVLPVVMAASLAADRRGPVWLVLGMGASFVALGLVLARLGPALGLAPEAVAAAAAVAMIGFGALLLVPALGARFAGATAGIAARADAGIGRLDQAGPARMLGAGALLGAVWSPCIGPTLGGAIALAARGEALAQAAAVMMAFALGVGAVMLALAYGARAAIGRRQAALRRASGLAKPVMGGVLVALGAAVLLGVPQMIEGWVLDTLPDWFNDLSILF